MKTIATGIILLWIIRSYALEAPEAKNGTFRPIRLENLVYASSSPYVEYCPTFSPINQGYRIHSDSNSNRRDLRYFSKESGDGYFDNEDFYTENFGHRLRDLNCQWIGENDEIISNLKPFSVAQGASRSLRQCSANAICTLKILTRQSYETIANLPLDTDRYDLEKFVKEFQYEAVLPKITCLSKDFKTCPPAAECALDGGFFRRLPVNSTPVLSPENGKDVSR